MGSLGSGKNERDETMDHKMCTLPIEEKEAVIQYTFFNFLAYGNEPFVTNKSSQKTKMRKKV